MVGIVTKPTIAAMDMVTSAVRSVVKAGIVPDVVSVGADAFEQLGRCDYVSILVGTNWYTVPVKLSNEIEPHLALAMMKSEVCYEP